MWRCRLLRPDGPCGAKVPRPAWSRTRCACEQPSSWCLSPHYGVIAVAVVLIAFMTMITRRKATSQVVGFLSMENGLFFGAMSATYGMPMIVEFGVALDVLVAMLVLGVFFFQIREQFDSLDLKHLESLKEEQ